MAWREISDVSEAELKKFFGPGTRKVWLDLLPAELTHKEKGEKYRAKFAKDFKAALNEELPLIIERRAELPILHVYDGDFMPLLEEGRNLYAMGYFYSCVTACAVVAEKIARGVYRERLHVKWPLHDLTEDEMKPLNRLEALSVANFLVKLGVLGKPSRSAFQKLLEMRNEFAHGLGQPSKEGALRACFLLQEFLDGTVSVAPGETWLI